MEPESEGKISYDHAIESAASFQNSLAGGSRGMWQTVARVNFDLRCCLRKCFEKN